MDRHQLTDEQMDSAADAANEANTSMVVALEKAGWLVDDADRTSITMKHPNGTTITVDIEDMVEDLLESRHGQAIA